MKRKKLFIKILNKIRKNNKKIIGYGATAKAVTVLNYCNIDYDLIKNFTDTTPEKINTFVPGKNIKILGLHLLSSTKCFGFKTPRCQ